MDKLKVMNVLTDEEHSESLAPDESDGDLPDGYYDQVMDARLNDCPFPKEDFRTTPGSKCWHPEDKESFEEAHAVLVENFPNGHYVQLEDVHITFNRTPASQEEALEALKQHKPSKKKCKHKEVDWSSVRPADGAPGIVDVWCKCGQSGSVRIDPEEIQWEP
jgi:hypothetical protein